MIMLYGCRTPGSGRSWQAIREDELAAASNGINTVTTKLLAFALGASVAGLGGRVQRLKFIIVSPSQFLFAVSFTVLAMVVLGGMGNIWGVALGAFIIYIIQTVFLKQLNIFFDTFHVPILSATSTSSSTSSCCTASHWWDDAAAPEGLFPSRRRAARAAHPRTSRRGADVEGADPEGPLRQG